MLKIGEGVAHIIVIKKVIGGIQLRKNISIFVMMLVVVFLVISGKFFYIQAFQSKDLQDRVIEQRVKKIEEAPKRGTISDRNGNVYSMSLNVKDIAVYPNLIKKEKTREKISKTISEILDMEYDDVYESVSEKDNEGNYVQWSIVAKKVKPEKANEINNTDIKSFVSIANSPTRHYLNNELSSNILGFVNDEGEPGAGLELSLNNYLSGIKGYRISELDNMGERIPIGMETVSKPIEGSSVSLTTDSFIQNIMEKNIKKHAKKMKAKEVHSIIMDPKNGDIIGMASYPNFNPNKYQDYDKKTYNNHGASYVYEPGSTFKPIYTAVALDNGSIDAGTHFHDSGVIYQNGHSISNWDRRGLGTLSLEDIIVQSSNVAMVEMSKTISNKDVYKGLNKFGIGETTGIELPNDEPGMAPTLEALENDPLAKMTQSFGHGIATTPLQIVTAYAQIINGGEKVKPTLIKEIEDPNGNIIFTNEEEIEGAEKIIDDESAKLVKQYLEASWDYTNEDELPKNFSGGGKTGTTTKLKNGVYTQDIVGSYVGYITDGSKENKPEYLMITVVDDPKGYEYRFGATSAMPIFKDVMEEIAEYKGWDEKGKKKKKKKEKVIDVSDYKLWFVEDAIEDLKNKLKKEVEVKTEGDGDIVKSQEYKYKNNKLHSTIVTTEIRSPEGIFIPDLMNLEPKEIYELFEGQGIEVDFLGTGKVFEQSVKPGIYKKDIKKIRLWLN